LKISPVALFFTQAAKTPLDKLRQSSSFASVIFVHSRKFDKAAAKLFTDEELAAL